MLIYRALNTITGESYIGQTSRSLKIRKAEHLRRAQQIERQAHPSLLSLAIREHGSGVFEWIELETNVMTSDLNIREIYYIKLYNTMHPYGYNSTKGGYMDGDMNQQIRDKIAESMRKLHLNPEFRANLYPQLKGRKAPNKGISMSEDQKMKVSAARKAVYDDPTYVNPNIGQKRAGEALDNLKKAYETRVLPKGEDWAKAHSNQYTEEVRFKMRAAKIGKKPANTKKILCIETGEVFQGLTEAAEKLALPRQSIWLQIKGKLKKVGSKYTFKYVDDDVE